MKYTGGCHCGKVRYEVEFEPPVDKQKVISCNCSMCSKKGHLLAFVPASQLTLVSGAESLGDYQFNKHVIHHLFCKECGISSFGRGVGKDGQEMCSINARCLDGVDIDTLDVMKFDGKSR